MTEIVTYEHVPMEMDIAMTVDVEFVQQGVKGKKASMHTFNHTERFRDEYKKVAGEAELSVGVEGYFSGSAKAAWDLVDHLVTKNVDTAMVNQSNEIEYQPGSYQIFRKVTTHISINGSHSGTLTTDDYVDTSEQGKPFSHEELRQRAKLYLDDRYGDFTRISDVQAYKKVRVPTIELVDPFDKKTFIMKNVYPGATGTCGGTYVSFGGKAPHPVNANYNEDSAMRVTFHKVSHYKDHVYRMKCCSHGNNYWVSYSGEKKWLYATYQHEKDAIPVKLYTAPDGAYKMQNMWPGQDFEGKWVSFANDGKWLLANYNFDDAMPMKLEERST